LNVTQIRPQTPSRLQKPISELLGEDNRISQTISQDWPELRELVRCEIEFFECMKIVLIADATKSNGHVGWPRAVTSREPAAALFQAARACDELVEDESCAIEVRHPELMRCRR
jgi:hypothetical protein